MPLAHRHILIVGGTSGLGRSAALHFLSLGARVSVTGRDPAKVADSALLLGDSGLALAQDAADPLSTPAAIAQATAKLGPLHGLYHVAGGSGRRFGDGSLHEVTDHGIDHTLDLNLKSVLYSNRAALQTFLAQGTGGAILNMGSVLARSPSPAHFSTHVYAAAKAAIEGLSLSLAARYASHNIRVNVIAPALTDTPMANRAISDPAISSFIAQKQPLDGGRPALPQDLDAAAALLLSPAASFITGQVLAVDGGWSLSG